ncbi:hypothetical protein HanIR_Chr07g0333531 [Helianthus annuus]|nr:hypothetical protein HanIR_Chr07g0333531 [Helianthus annuus]
MGQSHLFFKPKIELGGSPHWRDWTAIKVGRQRALAQRFICFFLGGRLGSMRGILLTCDWAEDKWDGSNNIEKRYHII